MPPMTDKFLTGLGVPQMTLESVKSVGHWVDFVRLGACQYVILLCIWAPWGSKVTKTMHKKGRRMADSEYQNRSPSLQKVCRPLALV